MRAAKVNQAPEEKLLPFGLMLLGGKFYNVLLVAPVLGRHDVPQAVVKPATGRWILAQSKNTASASVGAG